MIADAVNAGSIMSREVVTLRADSSLKDASLALSKADRTGAPVVDDAGALQGYLSLRDIVKAGHTGQMGAPVHSHMARKVVTGTPGMSLREIEGLFYSHTIYDLPIVDEGTLVGIVTRDLYLKARAEL